MLLHVPPLPLEPPGPVEQVFAFCIRVSPGAVTLVAGVAAKVDAARDSGRAPFARRF